MTCIQPHDRFITRAGSRFWIAMVSLLAGVAFATPASALIITGGPTYSLPGGGSCSVSGVTTTGTGATVSCTGIALGSHTNVYFGVKSNATPNGNTMTGVDPAASSAAVFRSSSTTASSITYTSTTTVSSSIAGFGSSTVTNTLRLSVIGGSASVVNVAGNPANSASFGDIGHLFRITSGSILTLDVDVLASNVHFGLSQAAPGVYDPEHSTAGNGGDHSRVDVAFYYSDCGDGQTDSPEQCDAGVANGTAGSCCSSTCTFKANLTACTDDGNQCTNDQCNGASATCQHPNKTNGTSCVGNGSGECSNADTCVSGVCQNNDVAANTPCSDSSPTNCKAARCNGSNVCDQNFTNETNGSSCTGANGTGECTNADTCLSGVCQDNDKPSGTACTDLTPTDCQDARCNGTNACVQTFTNEPDGSPCAGNGFNDCSNPDTCSSGTCQNNDVVSGTPCGSSGDTDCDNPDTCDGSGTCDSNFEPNTVVCRAATTGGVCDEVENCDGFGNCPGDGYKPTGTPCRADSGECDVPESCLGTSPFCPPDGFEPASTPCGDPTDTDCNNPDTCDGSNNCLANFELAGTACGSSGNTDCDNPDTCNASGTCLANNEPMGTPCGSPSDTDCTNPDTCDGAATCLANDASNGTSCNDGDNCTSGETCTTGVCGGGADACPDLDHYKCYQGKDLKNPKFVQQVGVDTDDQIVTNQLVDVKKLKFVCAPVDKNGEGINDPIKHLACYQLKADSLAPRPKVEVSTQFQTSQFELKRAKLLCLPTTKVVLP